MAKKFVYLSVEEGNVDIIINRNVKKNPVVRISANGTEVYRIVEWLVEYGISAGKALVYVMDFSAMKKLEAVIGRDALEFINFPDQGDTFSVLEFYDILMNRAMVPFAKYLVPETACSHFGITSTGAEAVKDLHERCLAVLNKTIQESE